ncbi:MAG: DUF4097 family beta strand repeat-containing protein [Acidobacteriota bacterium]
MRVRDVILILIIIVAGLSMQSVISLKEKGFPIMFDIKGKPNRFVETKEIDFPMGCAMKVKNSHGNVTLSPWDRETVHVQLEKVIYADDEKRAEEISKQIILNLEKRDKEAVISTNRDELYLRPISVQTNLTIHAPKQSASSITCSHGDVMVHGMEGASEVKSRHSDLEMKNVSGDVTINMEHGDAILDSITGNIIADSRHGKLEFNNIIGTLALQAEHDSVQILHVARNLSIKSRHTELLLTDVGGDIEIDSEHTEIGGSHINGNAMIKNSYKDVELSEVTGTLRIDTRHCDVQVERAVSNSDIIAEYGDVTLRIPGGLNFSVDLAADYGDIESDFEELKPSHEKVTSRLIARIGSGGPTYTVRTRYNDIYLQKISYN